MPKGMDIAFTVKFDIYNCVKQDYQTLELTRTLQKSEAMRKPKNTPRLKTLSLFNAFYGFHIALLFL